MSQIRNVLLGVSMVATALSAAQFASGHDLMDHLLAEPPGLAVNRASKADRLGDLKLPPIPTKTVSLRLSDLADTSVVLRIPSAQVRTTQPTRNQSRKPTLACEPMVSVLTEVAKILPPGRCVT